MKSIITLMLIILLIGHVAGQHYKLAPEKSKVVWIGYGEIGNFSQTGTLTCKEGSFHMMDEKITEGTIIFDMNTIAHDDSQLENHLKAKDFFHVTKYPTALFEVISGSLNVVQGRLTMRGVTHEVMMDIDLKDDGQVLHLQGNITIDRTKYNIKYNSSSYFQDLGNYAIKNEFDIEVNVIFKETKYLSKPSP